MARYIDAEKIKFTGDVSYDDDDNVFVTLEDVKRAIAQTPTADVVEVRHGKWEFVSNNGVWSMRCSSCHNLPDFGVNVKRYCPNCGAKM